MPPKKKKTQLKPIARGFATTSQPKKIKEDAVEPESTISLLTTDNTTHSETDTDHVSNKDPSLAAPPPETNTNIMEEQSLQYLVDKFQDKTEKDILRTIKAIETERRFAQTLPHLDFDSTFIDNILQLASSTESKATKANDDTEDKIIPRLGITHGVLRRLGYSENVVEKCLRNLNTFELDEAFDWLYMNCSELELESEKTERHETEMLRLSAGVSLQRYSTPPATPRIQSEPSSRLRKPVEPRSPVLYGDLRATPLVGFPVMNSQVIFNFEEETVDNLDSADPTTLFARTKLLHDVIGTIPGAAERLQTLRKQMDTASRDYLFDEKEAKVLYNQQRHRLNEKLLEERLLSHSLMTVVPPNNVAGTSLTNPDTLTSTNDSDSDDSSTGMLGILDNPDASEITVKGITISLRTMVLPKHWSGPMPKILLRDFVVKQDRYAAISYSPLSTHSRARRASVTVSWQNKRRDEWTMDDVACTDDSQAENYAATVALHSLTYPMTAGSASLSPASSSSSTSFRLLPASYRELWDELEASRRESEDRINRHTWAKLRAILQDKTIVKKADKQTKQISEKDQPIRAQSTYDSMNAIDPMASIFQARKLTPYFESILAQRNGLPISQYRNDILQLLENSQVLVLSGETGCGKSTQVPSFILEHHLSQGKSCKVICTEPRRISAVSLAQRVSYELCDPPNSVGASNSLIGYSIRLESNISRSTRLAFVTNGIALRMLEGGSGHGGQGTALDDITHIVVDEVHERTIESDFLLIVLKKLLTERSDLRVILMSATMDANKISAYFDNCPTLHVPGRTFPVTIQYLEDAIEYTRWTISESSPYARRWSDKFYKGKNRPEWTEELTTLDDDDDDDTNSSQGPNFKLEKRYSPETTTTLNMLDERLILYDLIIRLIEKICFEDTHYRSFSAAILIFVPGLGEIRRLNDMLVEHPLLGSSDFRLYPLHSTLSSESQSAVFDIPSPGVRKIVIATNIAETGITIPDITCVIDTGRHREMRFDEKRQLSRLLETFIAKSNAAQRRGRAGRVQRGLCFHLFTKLRHETQMAESPLPEIMRLSLSDLALKIKILNVNLGASIGDVLSRALDPPMAINIQRAVSMLVEVKALTPSEDITPMGRLLSKLPADVHLGKFLLISTVFRCLDPALTIAATLNSKSPFVVPLGLEQDADRAKSSFRTDNSDFLTIHNAFSSWRRTCSNSGFARKFCRANFMSHQNLQQIEDLRQQFLGYLIDSSFIQVDKSVLKELSRARYARNKTRFVTVPPELDSNPVLVHAALAAGLYPKILSVNNKNAELRTITNNQHAFFHPTSVNFGRNPTDFGVSYLSYFTLMHSKKLYAWETGPVDDLSLILLCGDAEHKLSSDTISIDRKIRFCLSPRANLALKLLRDQIGNLLAHQYQGKSLGDIQNSWKDLGLLALGRVKIKPDDNAQPAK